MLPVLLAGATGPIVHAAEPPSADAVTLDRIQVTASRSPRDRHDTAAAISIVEGSSLDTASMGVALSETLSGVPGVLARQRQNYAQDEQISIRGFGTRASFGIRSVRLYVDGIPATMPDGQGQVAHFPLASAARIEVLRGPFSALYGNSAGGVIQLFTVDAGEAHALGGALAAGAFGQRRIALQASGPAGILDYVVGASHFRTDGWRDHSRARRSGLNVKLRTAVAGGELTLLANAFDSPGTRDPQGLTREQYVADPRQASAGALRFDTRKSVRQVQTGAVFERPLDDRHELRALVYAGRRAIEQVLSTPPEAQRSPLSAGGWVELAAPFAGADLRWTGRYGDAGRLEVVAGLALESQTQHRSGYENFSGPTLGTRGAPRLRQDDRVRSVDPYVQATWRPVDAWTVAGGLRHSEVDFRSRDRYVTARNPDDSGSVTHRALSPVLGVSRALRDGASVFAAAGRGFETPTFNELGYRPDGASGLNFALRPMRTRSFEAGVRIDGRARAELALFRTDTRDELAVNSSSGGRTTFRNAGRARREGIEGALDLPVADDWRIRVAATWLDARYRDAFRECVAPSCPDAAVIPAGTRIPGVPRLQLNAALRHGGTRGWHAQLDAQHVGAVTANTRGDERAAGFTLFGASLGYGFARGGREGRVFAGIANLFDRRHVGAVIVNESNRRYYEPGAGRSVVVGIELR